MAWQTDWTPLDVTNWNTANYPAYLSDTPSTCLSGASSSTGTPNPTAAAHDYVKQQKQTAAQNRALSGGGPLAVYKTNQPLCKGGYHRRDIGVGVGATHAAGIATGQSKLAALAGKNGGGRKKTRSYRRRSSSSSSRRKSRSRRKRRSRSRRKSSSRRKSKSRRKSRSRRKR